MAIRLGLNAKLYRNTGSYASPTWNEIGNVKDVTLNLESAEADVTVRANNGWRATVPTLKDASVEFEMVWDSDDEDFEAVRDARDPRARRARHRGRFERQPRPPRRLQRDQLLAERTAGGGAQRQRHAQARVLDQSAHVACRRLTTLWSRPMRTFKDNAGRTWTIALTVAAVKRVRDLAKLDLLDLANGRVFERLVADPVTLCDALYAVCKPQADAEGITDEEFGEAMAGDAIEHASKALVEELIQFFPNARERAALSRVVRTMDAVMDRARDTVERRLDSGEIDRAIAAAMADASENRTVGASSTASPVSSASIQAV